jgi:hypothetical protein
LVDRWGVFASLSVIWKALSSPLLLSKFTHDSQHVSPDQQQGSGMQDRACAGIYWHLQPADGLTSVTQQNSTTACWVPQLSCTASCTHCTPSQTYTASPWLHHALHNMHNVNANINAYSSALHEPMLCIQDCNVHLIY